MEYLVAIDQGSSKTDVLVLNLDGKIICRTNDSLIRCKTEAFEVKRWDYIAYAVKCALASIAVMPQHISYVIAAVCGADWDEDVVSYADRISSSLGVERERVIVINDCIAALRSGFECDRISGNAAVLCAGTRLNCSLISDNGKMYTYGRFINTIDHGAWALGQEAWYAIVDSYNGFIGPTLLTDIFLQYYNADSITELYKGFTSGRLIFYAAEYAQILFDAAKMGDKVAADIVHSFVLRWIKYIVNGLNHIGLSSTDFFKLFLTGGLFKDESEYLYKDICETIQAECPNALCKRPALDPVSGAALLLLERIDSRLITNFFASV